MDLRYGENPHQQAAFYRELADQANLLPDSLQLQGKELSFNNLLDLNAAYQLSAEFELPCAVVIKHNNPCGVAVSREALADAYLKARNCDPVSAFGSVLGFNRPVDFQTAQAITQTFVEAVIAPGYEPKALKRLGFRKNLRLLRSAVSEEPPPAGTTNGLKAAFWCRKWIGDRRMRAGGRWSPIAPPPPGSGRRSDLPGKWRNT